MILTDTCYVLDPNVLSDSQLNCNNSILSDHLSVRDLAFELYGADARFIDDDKEQPTYENDKAISINHQEERAKIVYGDMWRPDLPELQVIANHWALQDTVLFHHEGHLLNLHHNSMNSCYIDAPFEMLMQSIFPILRQEGYIPFNASNSVDRILHRSSMLYNNRTLGSRYEASRSFRSFVWEEFPSFKPSIMADVDEMFRFLLQEASMDLRGMFTLHFTRKIICPVDGELDAVRDKENAPVRTISPYDIRTRNLWAANSKLINETINTILERRKTVRCPTCDGRAVRKSMAIYHPPFTFFHDGSNAAKHPQNIPFPPHITIHNEPYVFHGKIISTLKEGIHLYS